VRNGADACLYEPVRDTVSHMSDPQHIPAPLEGRTIRQPVIGPFHDICSGADVSFPKPGELIEIHGHANLTMQDRRTLNLLIVNAWPQITEDIEHRIHKAHLTGTHESTDRLTETMARLRTVSVTLRGRRNGKSGTWEDNFLGPTFREDDPDGFLHYRFSQTVREIIRESDHWARLQVMFALSSKYAQALYEMLCKRAGLTSKFSETFSLEDIRAFLGVPTKKLSRFPDLRRYCLQPAVDEVNALSAVYCRFDPIKKGRAVTKVKMTWFPKDEAGLMLAYKELERHRSGRKIRMSGKIEPIAIVHDEGLQDDIGT
jgi:hypothetical protein